MSNLKDIESQVVGRAVYNRAMKRFKETDQELEETLDYHSEQLQTIQNQAGIPNHEECMTIARLKKKRNTPPLFVPSTSITKKNTLYLKLEISFVKCVTYCKYHPEKLGELIQIWKEYSLSSRSFINGVFICHWINNTAPVLIESEIYEVSDEGDDVSDENDTGDDVSDEGKNGLFLCYTDRFHSRTKFLHFLQRKVFFSFLYPDQEQLQSNLCAHCGKGPRTSHCAN